jgi:hypothetical protein
MRAGGPMALAVLLGLGAMWGSAGTAADKPASPIAFAYQPIAFTLDSDETPAKRAPETMAGGAAIFDYNNDGNPDIFFANGADNTTLKKTGPKYWNRLFRNNGDGTFTDVTEKAGLKGTGYDTAVVVGDYDNDGYEDLFVGGVHRSTLYHNNGDGTFTDVTVKAGLDQALNKPDAQFGPLWAMGGAFVDVNNDGLLDLLVVNYLAWDEHREPPCVYQDKPEYCHPKFYKETPNQLFLNKGNGVFEDISEPSGLRAHPGKGMGVGLADFDGDGLPDFFVANDKMFNSMFHNKGGNKFEEMALETDVAMASGGAMISGMGVDAQDVDNDGKPDIAVVALDHETFPLWKNAGKMEFNEITTASGLARLSVPMAGYSPNFGDFDNDGWKDLFVSRGHVQSPRMAETKPINEPNTVFRNLGRDEKGMIRWAALTEETGFASVAPKRHRGAAVADLNHDGKLDVVVTALSEPAEIWINKSPDHHHWIELKLEGTKSNRDGIGAMVKVVTRSGPQWVYKTNAAGYASASAGPVHFGLGDDAKVESIEIRWPSGIVQTLKDVAVDRVMRVKEAIPGGDQ